MKTLNRIDLIVQSILFPGTILHAILEYDPKFWSILTPYIIVGAWQLVISISYLFYWKTVSPQRKRYLKALLWTLGLMLLASPLFIITGWVALAFTPFMAFWNYASAFKEWKRTNEQYTQPSTTALAEEKH